MVYVLKYTGIYCVCLSRHTCIVCVKLNILFIFIYIIQENKIFMTIEKKSLNIELSQFSK